MLYDSKFNLSRIPSRTRRIGSISCTPLQFDSSFNLMRMPKWFGTDNNCYFVYVRPISITEEFVAGSEQYFQVTKYEQSFASISCHALESELTFFEYTNPFQLNLWLSMASLLTIFRFLKISLRINFIIAKAWNQNWYSAHA